MEPIYTEGQIDLSKLDIVKEMDRWKSVISTNEANLKNEAFSDTICYGLINAAKQNLEYLEQLSLPVVID